MLELKDVYKNFEGKQAVNSLSFKLEPGQILSIIGQNGAGKSTTFRMILNFIKPDSGSILWKDHEMTDKDRLAIGFMPEERGLYQKESIENQILFFAELHGMKRREAKIDLANWMKKMEVVGKPKDKVETLSKGNAQKIQLIASMMFHPKLLILDEPFSGLDPVNAAILNEQILLARDEGTMIIFSSHNMNNVEKISDNILMLRKGNTVLQGSPLSIYKRFKRLNIHLEGYHDIETIRRYRDVSAIKHNNDGSFDISLKNEEVGKLIFREVTKNGYIPVFNQHYFSLDEIFKREAVVADDEVIVK